MSGMIRLKKAFSMVVVLLLATSILFTGISVSAAAKLSSKQKNAIRALLWVVDPSAEFITISAAFIHNGEQTPILGSLSNPQEDMKDLIEGINEIKSCGYFKFTIESSSQ